MSKVVVALGSFIVGALVGSISLGSHSTIVAQAPSSPVGGARFRYSGTGISFSLAAVLGGTIPPPLLARLVGQNILQNWFYLPLMYTLYCAAAMLALLFLPETRDISLEDLDLKQPQAVPAIP